MTTLANPAGDSMNTTEKPKTKQTAKYNVQQIFLVTDKIFYISNIVYKLSYLLLGYTMIAFTVYRLRPQESTLP